MWGNTLPNEQLKNKVVEEKYNEMMVSTDESCNDNLCKSCNSPTCCCSYELC